jgi:hypothetical protein
MKVREEPKHLPIGVLASSWSNHSLRPNPEYQRGSSWSLQQRQLLIDSIFRSYPLPRFYFHARQTLDPLGAQVTNLEVIDGQQRLIAIADYLDDKWPLFSATDDKIALPDAIRAQEAPWLGKSFSSLSDALQDRLRAVEVSVVLIDEASVEEVRDLFIRLQAGTPLTAQQVRDAWPGSVGPFIEKLAGKQTRQGQYQTLFSYVDRRGRAVGDDDELNDPALDGRQTCAYLLALLLAVERGKTPPNWRNAVLNDLYHEEAEFDTQGRVAQLLQEILEGVYGILSSRPPSVGKKAIKRSRLVSLFLLVREIVYSQVDTRRAIAELARAYWSDRFTSEDEPLGRTTSAKGIAEHYSWLSRKLASMVSLPELDTRRSFSESQKQEIWSLNDGRCGVCGQIIEPGMQEYDHIRPWILGGATEVSNGRPVHQGCHQRGPGSSFTKAMLTD